MGAPALTEPERFNHCGTRYENVLAANIIIKNECEWSES